MLFFCVHDSSGRFDSRMLFINLLRFRKSVPDLWRSDLRSLLEKRRFNRQPSSSLMLGGNVEPDVDDQANNGDFRWTFVSTDRRFVDSFILIVFQLCRFWFVCLFRIQRNGKQMVTPEARPGTWRIWRTAPKDEKQKKTIGGTNME